MAHAVLSRRAIVLVAAVAALGVFPYVARAQEGGASGPDVSNKRVTLTLENADIRYALKMLFQNVGVNYALDPAVQGTVTVTLNDVPFRTALDTIIKNAGAAVPL